MMQWSSEDFVKRDRAKATVKDPNETSEPLGSITGWCDSFPARRLSGRLEGHGP